MRIGKISPGLLGAVGLSCFLCLAGLGRAGTDWGQGSVGETFPVSFVQDGIPPAPGVVTSAPMASAETSSAHVYESAATTSAPVYQQCQTACSSRCGILGFRGVRARYQVCVPVQRVEIRTVEVGCVGRARIWNQPIRRFIQRRQSIRASRGVSTCGG